MAACFACGSLAIFSLSFRPPASLARPSLLFRSLFGRLLRLHGPRYLFVLFSAAYFACTALVVFSFSFRPPASLARTSLSFRSPLGFKKLDFSLVFKGFREKSLFYQKIVSRDILGPTWHDLGRFWLPFWHLFGIQNGKKTMLKTC